METILEQMGNANRLGAMIGARDFLALDAGLQFKFAGSKTANCVKIELNDADLYDVAFYKVKRGGLEFAVVQENSNVYADQLRRLFETTTGLYLSL
jgi:hypothetical protein